MTEAVQDLICKLYSLHETRKEMSYHSIYHAEYEKQAIELNEKIFKEIGINYVEIPKKMVDHIQKHRKE